MAKIPAALLLNKQDINAIRYRMFHWLQDHRSLFRTDIYALVKGDLSKPICEADFLSAFAAAFKQGWIPGYISKRGRFGGFFLDDPELAGQRLSDPTSYSAELAMDFPMSAPKPQLNGEPEQSHEPPVGQPQARPNPAGDSLRMEPVKPKPVAPKRVRLEVDGLSYEVPMSEADISLLLERVIGATEDPGGTIIYDGKTFACDPSDRETFQRFLFFFYGSSYEVNPNASPPFLS